MRSREDLRGIWKPCKFGSRVEKLKQYLPCLELLQLWEGELNWKKRGGFQTEKGGFLTSLEQRWTPFLKCVRGVLSYLLKLSLCGNVCVSPQPETCCIWEHTCIYYTLLYSPFIPRSRPLMLINDCYYLQESLAQVKHFSSKCID